MSFPLLSVQQLHYAPNKQQQLLHNVSFELSTASINLLCGANACGKTILLKQLNGLLKPTSGNIYLEGRNIWDDIQHTRQHIGLVFQDPDCQFVGETVREDWAFGLQNMGIAQQQIDQQIDQMSQNMGIEHLLDKHPYSLSGGEKHIAAIAAVLIMGAKLVLLDEPFNALDFHATQQLLQQMLSLQQQQQTAFLLITHDLEKVVAHADQLLLMAKGQIVQQGQVDSVLPFVEQFGVKMPTLQSRKWTDVSWLH